VDEGRLRAAVGRRGVPSHGAGVLAQPYPPLAAAAAGLRCRPRGGGGDRGAGGAAPAGAGLHGAEDAAATQDTVTQLVAAIRRVRRLIPAARTVKLGAHDYDRPGKPDCDWDDSDAKQALVSGLVNDALAVLAAVADAELGAEQAEAVALLALVAGQDVEAGERPGTFRIARRVARDRVISTSTRRLPAVRLLGPLDSLHSGDSLELERTGGREGPAPGAVVRRPCRGGR